jgi:hypothetical protein
MGALFFTNLGLQITFGLIQLPQNVTLTQIIGLLARGNEIRRTAKPAHVRQVDLREK